MAIIKAVKGKNNSKGCLKNVINYVKDKEKTEDRLVSGHNCGAKTVYEEMKNTKEIWDKEGGQQFKHYIQSFNPKDSLDIEKAHKITKEFVEKSEIFKKYEVLIATHKDTKHIHSHIVANSVSFEDGKKFRQRPHDLEKLKEKSVEICKSYDLSIPERGKNITTNDMNKYRAIEKDVKGQGYKSYVLQTAKDVEKVLNVAKSREEFIEKMNEKNYKVTWKETRKNVTFTTPEEKKVRNSNLEKTFKQEKFSKEGMEHEFRRNREGRGEQRTESREDKSRRDKTSSSDKYKDGEDGISKSPVDGIVGAIQSAVREIENRVKRATETTEERDSRIKRNSYESKEQQRDTERGRKRDRGGHSR